MLMMRSDLLFLSDEEVLKSLDAYKNFKSLSNAKKVKGTAKLSPSFSGIAAPNIIPKNVVDCQIIQQVAPPPTKWKYLFLSLFFFKYSFDIAKA